MSEPATIRSYRPLDHAPCRALWAELIEAERILYAEPTRGGADPGAGFEQYLTRLDLAGMWVAEDEEEGVVGLVGLVLGDATGRADEGRSGGISPLVVTADRRGAGIGQALLDHVARQARRRGLAQLLISPSSRNVEAIRCFHNAGFKVLSAVTLTLDLAPLAEGWRDGVDLHELRFSY